MATKRFIDNPLIENTDNVILPCTNVNDGKDYKATGKELLEIIKNSNPENLNVKVNKAVEAENSLNLGGVAAGDYALKSELPTESLATFGTNWINSVATCRNLLEVFKVETVQEAFQILKQKSDSGDFSGLGLGDYLDIPSITVSGWGTFTSDYQNTRVIIVGFDHYYNSLNNFHQIVFQFKNILTQKAMDSDGTNAGGYPAKQLYTKLNGDFTTGLQNAIGISVKEIYKPFHTSKNSFSGASGVVKCFIPSETEIVGHQNADQSPIWAGSGLSQYALYSIAPQLIMRKYNGSFWWWWLSSPYFDGSDSFTIINDMGINGRTNVSYPDGGVSPVFCI